MRNKESAERLLAIDPTTGGFGFVVFEGSNQLIDWGLQQVSGDKSAACLRRISKLLRHHEPDLLLLEDCTARGCRRSVRMRQLLARIAAFALSSRIRVSFISHDDVVRAFTEFGARNKDQIASVIVSWFPELASRLPKRRKPWMSEDERLGIFDAAALIVARQKTFFEAEAQF